MVLEMRKLLQDISRLGRSAVARLRSDRRGASAVEFALIAPLIATALLGVVDLGRAEYEKMSLDHALRAAAQKAMSDPGTAAVEQVLREAAAANFTDANGVLSSDLTIAPPARFCACPDNMTAAVACSTTCPNGRHTYVYYKMTASKAFTGFLIGRIEQVNLNASAQVQIR